MQKQRRFPPWLVASRLFVPGVAFWLARAVVVARDPYGIWAFKGTQGPHAKVPLGGTRGSHAKVPLRRTLDPHARVS